ncbi:MAG: PAS domain S-box protein [Gemmataceae bacterium]
MLERDSKNPADRELQSVLDLVENMDDLIQSVRPDGSIVFVNRAWRETLGYTADEVARMSIFDVIHPSTRDHCREVLGRALAGESVNHVPATFVDKEGRTVELEGSVNCRFENGVPVATRSVLRNVTERKKQEAIRAAEAIVLQSLGEGADLGRVLTVLLEAVENAGHDMLGSVLLFDESTKRLRHGSAPSLPPEYNRAVDGIEIGPGAGSCGTAAFRREPVIVEDIATDPLWTPFRQLALRHGLRACWSTPILAGERLLGTFALYYRNPRRPSADDLRMVDRMTQLARIAIERRRDEQALRESRQLLGIVMNTIPQGVFWKDRNSTYLGCNTVVADAMGLERPEQITGRTDFDSPAFTREQAEFFIEKDREVMEKNAPLLGIVEQLTRADGTTVWLETNKAPLRDEDGNVVGVLGTWQDISERKVAEEQLLRSEQKYRDLVETSHDLIWAVDPDGRWTFVNRFGARSIYGYEPEEMIGRRFTEFLSPEQVQRDLVMHERIKAGEPVFRYETEHIRKDGARVLLSFNAIPSHSRDGRLLGTTGTAVNITERRRAEEERRKLEEQFQQAQKLESLGVLAGGIAHDFNNLLTSMLGYASLARMQIPPESPASPMLEEIEHAALRAADLTRQMLAYSGRGKFVIQAIDLAIIVDEMAKLLGTVVSKKARLRLDLRPAPIEGDATQIRQVIMNLITNASDALGEGVGTIFLRTGTRHVDAESLQSAHTAERLPAGTYAFAEVQDTGCGMDDETIRRIYDPFFTTKFTGRGLGLAAVLGIVRGHKGVIRVNSAPGAGTTFQVFIPVAAPKPGTGVVKASALRRGSGTVLVADDEERVRGFAERVLADAGYRVLTATDGLEACDAFDRNRDELAGVVLDWTMPRMDGAAAARRIREHSRVPILFMSGFSEQDVAAKAAGLERVDFLPKPFQPSDLLDGLRRLIAS